MKAILSFFAGLASAFGLAWLYKNNQQFRQTVDNTRDQIRDQTQSAAQNFTEAAQSAGDKFKSNTSATADAARRAVFTRASARQRNSERSDTPTTSGTSTAGIDLNTCSREDLVGAGLTDELADKVLENRPYRNKLDLVSRLVIPESDYETIKHSISVDGAAANKSINVAS